MSGAIAPFVGKMLIGAVAGKVVGKVTGNDKLGLIAGLAAGALTPGTIGGAVPGVDEIANTTTMTDAAGNSLANMETVTPVMPSGATTPIGSAIEKGKGLLTSTGEWVKENPYGAIIGAQTAGGLVGMYETRRAEEAAAKEAEKVRAFEMAKLAEQEAANVRTYDREHQDFAPRAQSTYATPGMLRQGGVAPNSPGSDYYQKYLSMYQGGVR